MSTQAIDLNPYPIFQPTQNKKVENPTSNKIRGVFTNASKKIQEKYANLKESALKNGKPGSWVYEDLRIPGTTSILSAPFDLMVICKDFIKASAHNDTEAQLDLALRISVLPLGFLYSLTKVFINIIDFLSLFHLSKLITLNSAMTLFARGLNFVGLGLSTIEFILESISLFKSVSFFLSIFSFKNDDKNALENLNALKIRYFTISNDEEKNLQKIAKKKDLNIEDLRARLLKIKENKLMHRIRPWAAEKLKEAFKKGLLEEGSELNLDEAKELLYSIKAQSVKKAIVNLVGVASLLLALIYFILIIVEVPFIIPLILFGAFFALSMTRYLLAKGTLEQNGFQFSLSDCVPQFVKNGYKKTTELAKRALTHLQDSLREQKYLEIRGR